MHHSPDAAVPSLDQRMNPHVQWRGPAAVLGHNFVAHGGNEDRQRWNCGEVFRVAAGRRSAILQQCPT